jgi:hypothetical protein
MFLVFGIYIDIFCRLKFNGGVNIVLVRIVACRVGVNMCPTIKLMVLQDDLATQFAKANNTK